MRQVFAWMRQIGNVKAGTLPVPVPVPVPVLLLLLYAACSTASQRPTADQPQQAFPDIGGAGVMLFPVQRVVPTIGLPASADTTRPPSGLTMEALTVLEAELNYWLPERAQRARWVLTEAIERASTGSAALRITVRDLPIGDFQAASLRRIGDPLYGDLRRLAAVTDARLALVPLGAVWVPEQGGKGRVHIAAALIDTLGGGVLWHGVAAGSPADFDDHTALASTAQALALLIPR